MDANADFALKKKRELLGSLSKRKLSLRKYMDHFKQIECRLEISQITKCVFLGSLCLKPVPHLFDCPVLLEELDMKVGNVKEANPETNNENLAERTKKRSVKRKCLKDEQNKTAAKKKSLKTKPKQNQVKLETAAPDNKQEITPINNNLKFPESLSLEIYDNTFPPEFINHSTIPEAVNENESTVPQLETDSPPKLTLLKKAVVTPTQTDSNDAYIFIKQPNTDLNVAGEEALDLRIYPAETNPLYETPSVQEDSVFDSYTAEDLINMDRSPELILTDSDDDAIDQLMYNIMDIKIGNNVFVKDFYDMPPEIDEYEFQAEFNEEDSQASLPKVINRKIKEEERNKIFKRVPQCKICSQEFSSYVKLKKHRMEHNGEKPYRCVKCSDSYGSLDQLIAHLRTHKGQRPYVCKKCNQGFKTMKALESHRPVHVLRKVTTPKKTFRCETCQKEFRKLCDLDRHTRVHTGEKPSVCNICNKRFQQAHNLNKHLLIHTQEKPFQCDICSKSFGRNDVLNRHLLTHSVKKPNTCDVCNKSFIRASQLAQHKEKYHQGKSKHEDTTSIPQR